MRFRAPRSCAARRTGIVGDVLRRDAGGNRLRALEARARIEVHALRARPQVLAALGALAAREDLRVDERAAAGAARDLAEPGHVRVPRAFGRNPPRAGRRAGRAFGPRLPGALPVRSRRTPLAVVVLIAALLVFAVAHAGYVDARSPVSGAAGGSRGVGWTAVSQGKRPDRHGATVRGWHHGVTGL